MKIVLNLKDLISEGNITEDMSQIVEIPFNKAITLDDLPRSKSALHYHLYYTDVLEKLLKEGLIVKEQIEYDADDEGKLYILTLENVEFLNTIITSVVTIIIFSYIMYTISSEVILRNGEHLYISSLFVILGLFRYLQAIFVEKKGDSPTKLVLKDRFLQITILCWIVSFILIRFLYK